MALEENIFMLMSKSQGGVPSFWRSRSDEGLVDVQQLLATAVRDKVLIATGRRAAAEHGR
jgi:hypothetical protein